MSKIKEFFKDIFKRIGNYYIEYGAPLCLLLQIVGFLFFWWLLKNPIEAFATTFLLVPCVIVIFIISRFLSFLPFFLNWIIAIMAVGYYSKPVVNFLYLFIPVKYEVLFCFLISVCFFAINCLCVYEGFKKDELNEELKEE